MPMIRGQTKLTLVSKARHHYIKLKFFCSASQICRAQSAFGNTDASHIPEDYVRTDHQSCIDADNIRSVVNRLCAFLGMYFIIRDVLIVSDVASTTRYFHVHGERTRVFNLLMQVDYLISDVVYEFACDPQ